MWTSKARRTWAALTVAFATALIVTGAASADTGLATATIKQLSPGVPAAPPDCTLIVGAPAPGFSLSDEVFAGPFTDVSGKSAESKLFLKSNVQAVQNAAICIVSEPDALGYVNFFGLVGGTATIDRTDAAGKNTLVATYGSFAAGQLNLLSGEIAVQWLPGGSYTITGASGKFAKAFAVGESGAATATAYSPGAGSPEVGTLVISFDFEGKK